MDGRSIPKWTAAVILGVFAAAMLIQAELVGLVWAVPTLYVIPYTIGRIKISRAMHRELRSWLDG